MKNQQNRFQAAVQCLAAFQEIAHSHQEAAHFDAGFDAGEFSGPAHADMQESDERAALRAHGFTSLDQAVELVAARIGWRLMFKHFGYATCSTGIGMNAVVESELREYRARNTVFVGTQMPDRTINFSVPQKTDEPLSFVYGKSNAGRSLSC